MGALHPTNSCAQTKKILASQDYETATTGDWTCPNGSVNFKTGDATYGNYVQLSPSGNGNRSAYKSVEYSADPAGFTTENLATKGYVIEFDALLKSGNVSGRSVSQFVVPTTGPNLATNSSYSGSDYIFSLSQPQRDANSFSTTWYVNDLTNATATTVTLSNSKWYHYKLTVTNTGIDYAITDGTTSLIEGTLAKENETLPKISGFWTLLGRGYGSVQFDNMSIYEYTSGAVANAPTIILSGVNGKERSYTITYAEGETLNYQLPGATEYTQVTEGTSVTVKTSTSGTLSAYTENGSAKSATVTATVDASEITLNVPTYTLSNLSAGYVKDYTVSVDNSNLPLSPTATLSYVFTPTKGSAESAVSLGAGGTISSTNAGTYVITASADGYTSSILTIENNVAYTLVNEFNFSEMTAKDFSNTNVWEEGTDGDSKWGWSSDSPATKYTLKEPTTNAASAINGLELFSAATPIIYIGYGLMAPYSIGNYGKIKISNAAEGQYAVYTCLTNYGKTTTISVSNAESGYSLFRYSSMLKNIKVYSPTDKVEALAITAAGYATFVPTSNVKIPAAVKAYTVKVNDDKATITLGEIAADAVVKGGTAILVEGAEGSYNFAETTATETTLTDNDLLAADGTEVADGTQYGLAQVEGKVGFFKIKSGDTLTKGKAYLKVSDESAAKMSFFSLNGGELTAISGIEAAKAANGEFYTLQGVRVAKPSKGLYICNGKKVIVK
jgi:hypothetical protein